MEKYSQFRDRGSGISPFIPTTTPTSSVYNIVRAAVFVFRLPVFLTCVAVYFLLLVHLPLPLGARKLLLWGLLAIPGVWWVDLQLDNVKRGSLSQQPPSRFPHPRSVIASQFTSPIDAIYLAAIFDPIFTISFPDTQKVQRISLWRAVIRALQGPVLEPPTPMGLTTLRALVEQNPDRVIAVFPEMSTTNGKGILPLSPSLLSAPADAKLFPVSLRYTPPDITTPVPGAYGAFLWNLLSRPTHCIRVRIAEGTSNTAAAVNGLVNGAMEKGVDGDSRDLTPEEKNVIDYIADTLARLARNKRVGLTLRDKASFVETWSRKSR
ncbi:1-acylglycerol-3-phosphate O-acyltransferase [Microdochium nivale]|nr:1-acylglycerol-3-phosphate O-acyltransferase [Microdochium nivale]